MEMKNTFCPENGLTLKGHGHNFGGGGGGLFKWFINNMIVFDTYVKHSYKPDARM